MENIALPGHAFTGVTGKEFNQINEASPSVTDFH